MPTTARTSVVMVSERWRFSDRGDLRGNHHRQRDDRAGGAERPGAGQLGSLLGQLGHRRGQGPEGDVDQAVHQAEQGVADIGVGERGAAGEPARHGEQGDAQQHQRWPAEQEVGAEPAPPGGGLVDHLTGEHVRDRLPHPHHEQERSGRSGGDAGDVGVVQQEEHRRPREGEVVGHVPAGKAQVLGQAEPASLLRTRWGRGGGGGHRCRAASALVVSMTRRMVARPWWPSSPRW